MPNFPRVFPEIYRATVAAGEQSGHLDSVLERLADYTESREQIRQKVLGAMLYPIVLTVMCFAIVVGPAGLRGAQGGRGIRVQPSAKLPLITRALIGVSDFLRDYGIYVLIAAVIAACAVPALAAATRPPSARFHRWLLQLPLIGKLVRGFNTARFTRTFSILTAQRRAGAGGAAHRRRSGHQPADARCGHGGDRAGARGRADRSLAGREPAVSAR